MDAKELLKQVKDFASDANEAIDELSQFGELSLDHIDILTKSKEDYDQTVEVLSKEMDKILEIPHAGRHIWVGRLHEPIKINGSLTVSMLEISEPKPKRTVKATTIDHISFIPSEFSKFADALSANNYEVYDYKTISNTKLFKLKLKDVKFEFRDRSLADAEVLREEAREEGNDIETERAAKLRAIADYQNLKRQVEEERTHFMTIANAALLSKLLDILDDFDRALENDEKLDDGVKMIKDKLYNLVHEFGLKEIEVKVGDKLDPSMHEVIGAVNTDNNEEENTIKQIAQKGYTFAHNNQLVRPARVVVAKKQ